jgi:DNA-binding winged helix-turn-helix (wHTH) protein
VVAGDESDVLPEVARRLAPHGIQISTCSAGELDAHLAADRAGAVVVDGRQGLQPLVDVIGRLAGQTIPPEELRELERELVAGPALAEASSDGRMDGDDELEVGAIKFSASELRVSVNGRSAQLRPREVAILSFFLAHPGEVFSRSELMQSLWGYDIGDPSTVAVHIRRIRQKIEEDPAEPAILVTVWGAGYRLVVPEQKDPVAEAEPDAPMAVEDSGGDRTAGERRTADSRRPRRVRETNAPLPGADSHVQRSEGTRSADSAEQSPVRSTKSPSEERSRPPGRSTALGADLRNGRAPGPQWDGAVELARTRVLDALARLRRRRSPARLDPGVWAMIEAFASLRLDGTDVPFDPAEALVHGADPSGGDMASYLSALEMAAHPFAGGGDERARLDPTAPPPFEPLVTLEMLRHDDPTIFGRTTTLDEFVEVMARYDIGPASAGPVPRTVRIALATWAQRAGRLVTAQEATSPAAAEQRRLRLLLAVGRGAEFMDRAEQHVRRLRDLYVEESAASSSLKVIQLIDLFTATPTVTVERSAEVLDVSAQTVRNNVRRFEQMGWLVEVGRLGRGGQKYWFAREVVEAIMLSISEPVQGLGVADGIGRHVTGTDRRLSESAPV